MFFVIWGLYTVTTKTLLLSSPFVFPCCNPIVVTPSVHTLDQIFVIKTYCDNIGRLSNLVGFGFNSCFALLENKCFCEHLREEWDTQHSLSAICCDSM